MFTSKLRQRLEELSVEFNGRLPHIEGKARQLLEYSQAGSHMAFTPHGLSHISAVESSYDWLLTDSDFQSFNAAEIFCLLIAILFHDALMIPTALGREMEARASHAIAAHDFLLKNKDLIGLSVHEVDLIGEVIRGHGAIDLQTIRNQVILGSQIVDARKLAACLSLADIVHADSSRAPEIVFRHLDLDEESAYHWKRHMQISGITRKGDALLMSALTFSDRGETAVEEYRNAIVQQLLIIKPYFDSILQPLTRVDLSSKRLESPLDQTLRFQTNTAGVLKVLIEGVYDREDVFVRELVQNSLDACLLRRLKLGRRNAPYEPRILLTFFVQNKRVRSFRIDDNGVGMDLHDLRDTVLWIGSSIATKADVAELVKQSASKNLIATFGIGLLSCFKVSNRIFIRTAKEGAFPLSFALTSVSEAVKPEKSEDKEIGTTIIVDLTEAQLDLAETVFHYFRQIHSVQMHTLELEWSQELESHGREQFFRLARSEGIQVEPYEYSSDKFAVYIPVEDDDFRGHLWLSKEGSENVRDFEGTLDILNEGVFVANEESSDWLAPELHFLSGYVDFSARSLNLPAGRDRVIKDETFRQKASQLNAKAGRIIEKLIEHSRYGGTKRNDAALLTTYIYSLSDKENQPRLLRKLDDFCARIYKSDQLITLAELRKKAPRLIYVHYPKGRWVENLAQFDGKQLYHKQDDLTDLQAAIVSQQGEIVLAAARSDREFAQDNILEATLLDSYFAAVEIPLVDLSSTNTIEGKQRSKPVPESIRKRISNAVKFVDIVEIPNKISWLVGNEVWINIAHPLVARVYLRMQQRPEDDTVLALFEIFTDVVSYDLDSAFRNVCAALDLQERQHWIST